MESYYHRLRHDDIAWRESSQKAWQWRTKQQIIEQMWHRSQEVRAPYTGGWYGCTTHPEAPIPSCSQCPSLTDVFGEFPEPSSNWITGDVCLLPEAACSQWLTNRWVQNAHLFAPDLGSIHGAMHASELPETGEVRPQVKLHPCLGPCHSLSHCLRCNAVKRTPQ